MDRWMVACGAAGEACASCVVGSRALCRGSGASQAYAVHACVLSNVCCMPSICAHIKSVTPITAIMLLREQFVAADGAFRRPFQFPNPPRTRPPPPPAHSVCPSQLSLTLTLQEQLLPRTVCDGA
jgi:hypothetical protein